MGARYGRGSLGDLDAHIAEIARRAGARLVVTDNRRHFAGLLRFGIRVFSTEEFAAEAKL